MAAAFPPAGQGVFQERHAGPGWNAWLRSEVGPQRARMEDAWNVLRGVPVAGRPHDAFAVFDGLGGRPRGQEAAWAAAHGLEAVLARVAGPGEVLRALDAVVQRSGGATTATIALLPRGGADVVLLGVGDSSAYALAGGAVRPLLPRDRASPGIVTDCLGLELQEGHETRLALGLGEAILLCTDGIDDVVPPAALRAVLAAPPEAVEAALETLFAAVRARGAPDNATVLLVRRD